ncbi:MAG: hypothetical protein M3542_12045, partial [Acidobacteriota bacterium]|nr:hypothetical protein [Acidobacteriota bacterium]
MRLRPFVCAAAAMLSLLPVVRCASRGDTHPTIEEYSDGVSLWAEKFLDDWKAGAKDPELYASGFRWSGPLPGDELVEAPSRPPLAIR